MTMFTYICCILFVDKFKEAEGAGEEPGIDWEIAWGEETARRQSQASA